LERVPTHVGALFQFPDPTKADRCRPMGKRPVSAVLGRLP
jgi:hypothetical protein